MQRLVPLAAADDALLSDQGQDRTYQTMRNLLVSTSEVLANGREVTVDAAIAPMQQAFVVCMMDSSNFTKQLSGVRELRNAVHRVTHLPVSEESEERIQVRGWGSRGCGMQGSGKQWCLRLADLCNLQLASTILHLLLFMPCHTFSHHSSGFC
jgi:hypothetical protein